jgi:hypothetical protein
MLGENNAPPPPIPRELKLAGYAKAITEMKMKKRVQSFFIIAIFVNV